MSHELRTPMNAILGFSQLLEADTIHPLTEDQQEYVSEILTAGSHLLTLINEVLDLSRIEAGKLNLTIEDTNLDDIINECIHLVAPQLKERNITLEQDTDHSGHTIKADPTRIKQVLINLISNAIKYNKTNGQIFIKCQPKRDYMRISITDTGIGISADKIEQLFTAVNRLGAESSSTEGTGIGLVITKKIIELMNGQIGVNSQAGKGSTFWIDIPLALSKSPESQANKTEKPNTKQTAHLTGEVATVLYAEDNAANMSLVKQILKPYASIKLLCANEAVTGIKLVNEHQPDLILMDINLPGMDGFQALEQLRNEETTAHIPIIAVSANAMNIDIDRALAAGFNNYITKPLDIDKFINTIKQTLQPEP